jgi:hypothetical protein
VAITRRAIGALADATWPTVAGSDNSAAPIPAGTVAGDYMLLICVCRHADPTVATPAGWTSAFSGRGGVAGANDGIRIQLFWKFHDGSEVNPAIDWSASSAGPRNAFIVSYTGVDTTTPITNLPGALSFNATTGGGPGPITGFTPDAGTGAIIVIGAKADDWTTASALSGDGLTWNELMDAPTTAGNDAGLVVDDALNWTSGAITNKTFSVTGGTSVPSAGLMFALKAAAAFATVERSVGITGAASVAVGTTRRDLLRSASLSSAASVAVGQTRRDVQRSVAVAAAGTVTVADFERVLERSVGVSGASAISSLGQRIVERGVSFTATSDPEVEDFERDLQRSVSFAALTQISTRGERTLQRSVAIAAAAGVEVGETERVVERAIALAAIASVAVGHQKEVERSVSFSATSNVGVVGETEGETARSVEFSAASQITVGFERVLQRAASFSAVTSISVSGEVQAPSVVERSASFVAATLISVSGVRAGLSWPQDFDLTWPDSADDPWILDFEGEWPTDFDTEW